LEWRQQRPEFRTNQEAGNDDGRRRGRERQANDAGGERDDRWIHHNVVAPTVLGVT
jgi:hypothetical protein